MIRCSGCDYSGDGVNDQKDHLEQKHHDIKTKAGMIDYFARQDQRMTNIEEKLKQT